MAELAVEVSGTNGPAVVPAVSGRPAAACASLSHTATIPRIRPLAYGYMRGAHDDDAGDHHVRACELRIWDCAERRGLELAEICHDVHPGVGRTWVEFVAAVERAGARHVLVPSLGHLSSHPLLQRLMCDRLVRWTHADLIEVGDRP